MRKRIDCPDCDHRRRPAATDPGRCERCAGEPVLHECRRCHAQADNYDHGRCPPCALRERLDELRSGADPNALARLEPYLATLAAAPDPWRTVRWMRHSHSYRTLRRLAEGSLALTHQALDRLGPGPSVYLRAALLAHGVLPRREERAASFERAAARLLARPPDGEDLVHLRAYSSWQLHHHLLRRERRGLTTRSSARHEIQRLRAAVQLATWAHERALTLAQLGQHDLDRFLAEGAGARARVGDFLAWAQRGQITGPLAAPGHSVNRHSDQLPAEERVALARRLLDDQELEPRDRVGGLLVLLLAQPVSRLLELTTDHLNTSNDGRVTVRLGPEPLVLPQPLARLVADLAHQRRSDSRLTEGQPVWLFGGRRPDAPLGEQQFRRRLRRLGIPTLPARTGALHTLAATLPPAILADLLGISESNAANWARQAAGDWAGYAASRSHGHRSLA